MILNYLRNKIISCLGISINGKRFAPMTIRYMDANGNISTVTVLGTQDR